MAEAGSVLKGRWTIWAIALGFSLAAGFGVLTIVGQAADRATYYVLNTDVAARTQILEGMLTPVETSKLGAPVNAMTLADFQDVNNPKFALVKLYAGDVVSKSVVGPFKPLSDVLPPNYMIATIQVPPENAIGGRIQSGDRIDIAAVDTGDGVSTAQIVMHNVLVLDVTVSPSTIAGATDPNNPGNAPGPDAPQIYGGIPQIYTLAVTPEDFTKLALLKDYSVYLAFTGTTDETSIDASSTAADLFADGPVFNSSEGLNDNGTPDGETSDGATDGTTDETTTPPAPSGAPTPSNTNPPAPSGNATPTN